MKHQTMYFKAEAVPYEILEKGLNNGGFITSRTGDYWLKRVGNIVEVKMSKPDGRSLGLVKLTPDEVNTRATLVGGEFPGCHILLTRVEE